MTSRPRAGLLVGAVALSLLGVACDTTTTSTPPGSGSPSAAASSQPSAAPSQPANSLGTGIDLSNVAEALSELDSYAFSVEIQARNTQAGQTSIREGTTLMTGTVVNAPAKASTLHLTTAALDGTITAETEIVQIGETAYLRIDGAKGSWQLIPADQAGTFIQLMDAFRPEKMFALYFVPIGTDSTFVGHETRNGVASTHYRGGEDVGAILGTIAGVQGSWGSDVWLAQAGGHLVTAQAGVQGSDANGGGSFTIEVDITDVNTAGPITAPIRSG